MGKSHKNIKDLARSNLTISLSVVLVKSQGSLTVLLCIFLHPLLSDVKKFPTDIYINTLVSRGLWYYLFTSKKHSTKCKSLSLVVKKFTHPLELTSFIFHFMVFGVYQFFCLCNTMGQVFTICIWTLSVYLTGVKINFIFLM